MQIKWFDGKLTVTQETQTFNVATGGMDHDVHGEITASGEEWLRMAVVVLLMLPGKLNQEGTGYLLGPADTDPDMIGALVAAMMKDLQPPAS